VDLGSNLKGRSKVWWKKRNVEGEKVLEPWRRFTKSSYGSHFSSDGREVLSTF
jgi:hypothetical protein